MEQVRQAIASDIKYICKLCDENISEGFYTEQELSQICQNPDHYIYVYCDDNDIPVAFLYMFVAPYGQTPESFRVSEKITLPDDEPVCVFKTTCTDPEYRRKGILHLLMSYCEQVMKEQGIHTILLEALKHYPSGKVPAASGIKDMDFKIVQEVSQPWIHIRSYCPYCKNEYCHCNALLCVKEI